MLDIKTLVVILTANNATQLLEVKYE